MDSPKGSGGPVVSWRPTYALASQQVSWSDVHSFVLRRLQTVRDWPLAGSPAWCDLGDCERVKWASLLDASQHWVLRLEYFQTVEADASSDISAAGDWAGIARTLARRDAFLASRGEPVEHFRPWSDRRAAR